ncbi:DUF2177 family protein [Candidatus Dojkabacteria bacterium]|nr:DUF2177 family protein [Candidatus Dojkabacteria bacterium]
MIAKLYLLALPVFFTIDMIWLGLISRNFYKDQIGFLMKTNVNWIAAIIFYLVFILGIVVLVLEPSIKADSWTKALVLAALFGFATYATYDLTNLATIKDWPLLVTIVDLIWGTVLSTSVALITYFLAKQLGI